MIIQEIRAVYNNVYEQSVTRYIFIDAPVNAEKVERYCSKLMRGYKELVSFAPIGLYRVEFDDALIEFINSKSNLSMQPYHPFIERC